MSIISLCRKSHRRNAQTASCPSERIKIIKSKTYIALCLFIAFYNYITFPKLVPGSLMRFQQTIRPLIIGINNLAYGFTIRIGKIPGGAYRTQKGKLYGFSFLQCAGDRYSPRFFQQSEIERFLFINKACRTRHLVRTIPGRRTDTHNVLPGLSAFHLGIDRIGHTVFFRDFRPLQHLYRTVLKSLYFYLNHSGVRHIPQRTNTIPHFHLIQRIKRCDVGSSLHINLLPPTGNVLPFNSHIIHLQRKQKRIYTPQYPTDTMFTSVLEYMVQNDMPHRKRFFPR